MRKKLRQFAALDAGQKAILIQAWVLLGIYRAAVLVCPFKRLVAPLQHHKEMTVPPDLRVIQLQEAKRMGKLVAVAARHTPWQSPCLTQVITLQRMLARRGIPGHFYLGVRKGAALKGHPGRLEAHSWLQCADLIVNGAQGHQDYTVVSTFSWGPG